MCLGCQGFFGHSKLIIFLHWNMDLFFLPVSKLYNLKTTINDLLLMKYSAVETFLKCRVDKSCWTVHYL